ncbi:isocitrate lyase/phosphoenolpyruvate mutase family protein [Hamadaea sp. NPDC051192]|uniref:isocitrate lyase/PEP mutase family protein n=1 Tax=Hamadaea sp. NPDC051192 TaxID=3154940 RepID=UPI00343DC0C5
MTPPSSWAPGAGEWSGAGPDLVTGAATLRALHRPGDPVVLPNVWDVPSARAVEAAGFPAVATSSAALAETLGHADGETAPVGEILDAIARIVRAVGVPVTADVERGFRLSPAELVERLAATGVAGCNLEDSDPATGTMVDAARQSDFLAAIRAAARSAGVDLVVNARIDVFLKSTGTHDALAEAVDRARRYLAAGADCVFPILLDDPATVGAFVGEAGGPVNILGRLDGPPSVAELAALGVARISFGARVHAAVRRQHADLLARLSPRGR